MMLKAGCLLLLGGTVAANVGSSVSASVSLSASKVFTTQPAFVGATIDWWRNNDPVYGPKFGYGGALTIDLQSPSLRAVASGLAPGWLRIGGTPADGIVYEVHGGECANVSVNPEPTCTQNFTANKCDKCGDAYGCLKWDRWVELLTFGEICDSIFQPFCGTSIDFLAFRSQRDGDEHNLWTERLPVSPQAICHCL